MGRFRAGGHYSARFECAAPMKPSLLPFPHTCAGELCSCSLLCSAECSHLGDTRFIDDDDDFPSQFVVSQHQKSCSVDPQVEERDAVDCSKTSNSCDSKEVEEDPCEQSFRESFYSSGTDWSSLYFVDDYGIPCESWDLALMELHNDQSAQLGGQADARDHSSRSEGFEKSRNDLLLKSPTFRRAGCESSNGKLVQSSLSSFWGRKHQKIDGGGNVVEASLQKISDGAPMGEVTTVTPSHVWAKFKRPPASSVSVQPESSTKNSRFSNSATPMRGNLSSRRKCPFYKKIPGTSFTVDAFQYGAVEECKAYFLTHFHSDHYGGLTKSWTNGPIYCTPVTARLLSLCLSVDEKWIHPLPLGTSQFIDGVEVRMLDANHCPGAAIIHFRLKNGQAILHTGDFRACKAMQNYPELRKGSIHTLYLDTTYCNQRYRFPLQKEVIKFVVEVTQAALKKNSRTLVVVGAYSIGKERVYLGIAEALNVPIFVESRRSRILGALDWPEIVSKLSRDANGTLLHVLPIGYLRPQKLTSYLQGYPKYNAVLAFRPTGWTYSEKIGSELHLLKPTVSGSITMYGVPYSEHSNFTELQEFVQFLQPEIIIPTVNVGNPKTRDRMKSYFRQWLKK
ncbi:hypothetical protein GOP47_0020018 [Adiantum capillus-veneris]|uniref:DNA cross-link repair protein SNM1 n=1 Tax=Adiantum capillus-veneris TaxID=13818 RepID=A0A9D4UC64_ADICA|nr:hypothetical protein GOP47_0020018 [Adiantum capillus-veneris]